MNIIDLKKREEAIIREAQDRAAEYLTRPGVIKASTHLEKSGKPTPYYVDFDNYTHDPDMAKDVLELFKRRIAEIKSIRRVDALAFIEKAAGGTTGALRFSCALSIVTKLPNITVRMAKEIDFEQIKLPSRKGGDVKKRLEGLQQVLVTDHCTTGREVLKAADIIERNGGKVTDIVAFTVRQDRIERTREQFEKRNIEVWEILGLDGKFDSNNPNVKKAVISSYY